MQGMLMLEDSSKLWNLGKFPEVNWYFLVHRASLTLSRESCAELPQFGVS